MARHPYRFTDLTIPSGQTDSNVLSLSQDKVGIGMGIGMTIYTPAAYTAAITVQLSPVDNPSAGDWKTLQYVPGTDLTLVALKAVFISSGALFGAKAMRIHSAGAEGADRTHQLFTQIDSGEGGVL